MECGNSPSLFFQCHNSHLSASSCRPPPAHRKKNKKEKQHFDTLVQVFVGGEDENSLEAFWRSLKADETLKLSC